MEDVRAEIDNYVTFMRDSWIMGTTELNDTTWNQFVDTINGMGLDEVLQVYEDALQRAYDAGFEDGYHTLDEFNN